MKLLILAVFMMLSFKISADSRSCSIFLANPMIHTSSSDTVSFISYLSQLLDEKVIPLSYLQMLTDLEENRSLPSPFSTMSVQSAQSIHASMIQMYIEHTILDKKQIKDWAKNLLTEKEQDKKAKQETEKETRIAYTEMKFNQVKGGFFYAGKGRYDLDITDIRSKVPVNIDYDFEMMSTTVTVKMWLDVMGDLPEDVKKVALKDGPLLPNQYDMPIINITWWSTLVFANRLSEKNNLAPVYDLSGIVFTGKPEDGNYKPIDDRAAYNIFTARLKQKNILLDLREDGKLIHSLEKIQTLASSLGKEPGYRLPAIYEQEFVQSDRGRSTGPYFTGIDENNIEEVAWYRKNSKGAVHPVAQLSALIVDGQYFFDLFGNIHEFSTNYEIMPWVEREDKLCSLDARITSCYYNSEIKDLHLPSHSMGDSGQQSIAFGFRLVRSLPK